MTFDGFLAEHSCWEETRQDKELEELTLEDYRRFCPHFDQEVFHITAQSSAAARDNPGGTAPDRVAQALNQAEKLLEENADGH